MRVVLFVALCVFMPTKALEMTLDGDVFSSDAQPRGLAITQCRWSGSALEVQFRNDTHVYLFAIAAIAIHREFESDWIMARAASAELAPHEETRLYRFSYPPSYFFNNPAMGDLDAVRCSFSDFRRMPSPTQHIAPVPLQTTAVAPLPSAQINDPIFSGRHFISAPDVAKIRSKQVELSMLYGKRIYIVVEDRVPLNLGSYYGLGLMPRSGIFILGISPLRSDWRMSTQETDAQTLVQLAKGWRAMIASFKQKEWSAGILNLLNVLEQTYPKVTLENQPAAFYPTGLPQASPSPACDQPDVPARIVDQAMPEPHSYTQNIHQIVRVGVQLDQNGSIVGSPVVVSASSALLNYEAMATVLRSKFSPAVSHCVPIRSKLVVEIPF